MFFECEKENLLVENIVTWIVERVGEWGYLGIIIMMTIESSLIPFPSEVVMIPAGYLSHKGDMNIFLAILSGVSGSMIGAYFNYYLSVYLGRPLLLKVCHYVGISDKKFSKVEKYFRNHGEITTFIGRLIPAIRQLISCPAGLARMNIAKFSLYTALGAGFWVTVLVILGYFIGENTELLKKYSHQITIMTLALCVVIVGIYIYVKTRKPKEEKSEFAG